MAVRKHLAIFDRASIEKILTGTRTVEGRFSKINLAPFGQVVAGDKILMKVAGGPILGEFEVEKVVYFDHLSPEDLEDLKKKYSKNLGLSNQFWQGRDGINYATLIFVKSPARFLVPQTFPKRDLRAWVVLA